MLLNHGKVKTSHENRWQSEVVHVRLLASELLKHLSSHIMHLLGIKLALQPNQLELIGGDMEHID